MAKPSFGKFQLVPAGDLTIIMEIQRDPFVGARVKKIVNSGAINPMKLGVLYVIEIDDPQYPQHQGKKHVMDGGARLNGTLELEGPNYKLPCYMFKGTIEQAASTFLSHARSSKPAPLVEYKLGVEAGEEIFLAMKDAFDNVGIVGDSPASYGNGSGPGRIQAITACKSVLTTWEQEAGSYQGAAVVLTGVLDFTRSTYTTPGAHNAVFIQAVSTIWLLNQTKWPQQSTQDRMRDKIRIEEINYWSSKAQAKKGMMGSESRRNPLAQEFVDVYNTNLPKKSRLIGPYH